MSKPSILSVLQAAAVLPSGELRVLIALNTRPNLNLIELAGQVDVSPDYLTTVLSAMTQKRLITRKVRVVGDDDVENIYLLHPDLNFETLSTQYLPNARGTAAPASCSANLITTNQGTTESTEVSHVI